MIVREKNPISLACPISMFQAKIIDTWHIFLQTAVRMFQT